MPNSWQLLMTGLRISLARGGGVALLAALPLAAQAPAPMDTNALPIGRTRATEMQLSGDVRLRDGETQLGNGSTITAGTQTIPITLTRGGEILLCATTSVHLSRDRSIDAPDASGLMLALDRGAIEARYTTSKYSDVLLTPDLRILISGPGTADLSIRVNQQGDTCIDNRGVNAPYLTVSSQLDGGLYRVQPGQHVSFQHGDLRAVLDTEREPCGCPPPVSVADAGTPSPKGASPGHPVGDSSSAGAGTEFPLAISEGLAPAPAEPTTPVAAPGEVHAQVAVPFHYNASAPPAAGGSQPDDLPAPSAAAPAPVPSNMHGATGAPATPPTSAPVAPMAVAQPLPPPRPAASPRQQTGLLLRIGHFFGRLFGAGSDD